MYLILSQASDYTLNGNFNPSHAVDFKLDSLESLQKIIDYFRENRQFLDFKFTKEAPNYYFGSCVYKVCVDGKLTYHASDFDSSD